MYVLEVNNRTIIVGIVREIERFVLSQISRENIKFIERIRIFPCHERRH